MPIQARSVILLGPNPDLGLDKSPNQTKIKFFFMASLHTFFLRFIHSHTFRSSLRSANQLSKAMPVQLSSFLHDEKEFKKNSRSQIINTSLNFPEVEASIVMYLELKFHALPDASQGK